MYVDMLAFTSSQWKFNQGFLSRSNLFKEAQQDSQKQFQKIQPISVGQY